MDIHSTGVRPVKPIFDKLTPEEQAALQQYIALQIERARARWTMQAYGQRSQQPLPRPFEVLDLNDIHRPQDCFSCEP